MNVYESMTRIPLIVREPAVRQGWSPKLMGCVRIWRGEETEEAADNPDNADLMQYVAANWEAKSHKDLRAGIEALGRIAAIEILDENGNGSVTYYNWP